jgi:hypothetical protein
MAERKYDKYFIAHERSQREIEMGRTGAILRLDDNVMKGSFFYSASWVMPGTGNPPFGEPGKYIWYAGHPPHIHKYAELLIHIGSNPDDPTDLGAEVEMYMGPELERHVFTQSTVIFIPPNFIHAPWKPIRTWRPWIFLEINQGPVNTEKVYWQLLPEEVVAKIDRARFPDKGY